MITQAIRPKYKDLPRLNNQRVHEIGNSYSAMRDNRLNLHDHLVQYPATTYFVKVDGEENQGLGLNNGDILIVDRSLAPRHNSLVIADIDDEQIICRLLQQKNRWILQKGDGNTFPLNFEPGFQSPVWGKVTHVIHAV